MYGLSTLFLRKDREGMVIGTGTKRIMGRRAIMTRCPDVLSSQRIRNTMEDKQKYYKLWNMNDIGVHTGERS